MTKQIMAAYDITPHDAQAFAQKAAVALSFARRKRRQSRTMIKLAPSLRQLIVALQKHEGTFDNKRRLPSPRETCPRETCPRLPLATVTASTTSCTSSTSTIYQMYGMFPPQEGELEETGSIIEVSSEEARCVAMSFVGLKIKFKQMLKLVKISCGLSGKLWFACPWLDSPMQIVT